MHDQQTAPRPQAGPSRTPPLEWAVAALGLLLVLGSIATLLWFAVRGADAGVEPVIRVTAVERQAERYLVRIAVVNAGQASAAALRVRGRLQQGDQVIEESEVEFDNLPGRSVRSAGLFFRADPARHQLKVEATSYREP
jgi:uncharacterized protein (TIGR02588 family)